MLRNSIYSERRKMMDREKLRKQAAILRRKRMARTVNKNPRVNKKGVLKLETPLPIPERPKQKEIKSNPELRRQQANIAREAMMARRKAKERNAPGCGKCGRRKGNA